MVLLSLDMTGVGCCCPIVASSIAIACCLCICLQDGDSDELENCETLDEELNVAWEVDGDNIIIELTGAIGQ